MVDNTVFLEEINREQNFIQAAFSDTALNQDIKNRLLEYSFIRCVVKFQHFVSVCFESYASGESSSKGYTPHRKLAFLSPEHLHSFFDTLKKGYTIDVFENGIKNYSKHIFVEDPFALILQDSVLWSNYNKGRIIRNFLMHQSGSAEKEYRETILLNNPTASIMPYQDLLVITNSKTLYSTIIDSLTQISEILINPQPYFS